MLSMRKLGFSFRIVVVVVVVAAGVGIAGWGLSAGGTSRSVSRASAPERVAARAPAVAGTPARFVFLARQTSNSCGLQASAIGRMQGRARLQGSCCSPMNLDAYLSQVRGLRAYAGIRQIPPDPYDVPVSLTKRLLSYDQTIHLDAAQERTYEHAMAMSREKGPCCCHCWRWTAFQGLSDYLIANRAWGSHAIAHVIDLVEGCGGPLGA
jgi:hypothetical protein